MTVDNEQLVTTFRAKDGRLINIRPLENGDAPLLVSIFDNMGSDSRYNRFHQTMDNPNPARVQQEAEQMVASVPDDSFGLIAFDGDVPVGAARYVIFEEGKAETAVSLRDDYQNGGIGTKLVALIAQEAKKRRLHQLVANVQADNTYAISILEKLSFLRRQQLDDSVMQVIIDLTAPTN